MVHGELPETQQKGNRGAAVYHTFVAILLLLLGGGLLGLSIWLRVSEHGGPASLDYQAGATRVASIAAGVIGAFILGAAVSSLISLSRKVVGKVFRIIYVLMALCILGALILIAASSFFVVDKRDSPNVREALSTAWKQSLKRDGSDICSIESSLQCRSFADSSCKTETCASCPLAKASGVKETESCYNVILADLKKVYLPTGIVSVIAAVFVLVDIFVTCAL